MLITVSSHHSNTQPIFPKTACSCHPLVDSIFAWHDGYVIKMVGLMRCTVSQSNWVSVNKLAMEHPLYKIQSTFKQKLIITFYNNGIYLLFDYLPSELYRMYFNKWKIHCKMRKRPLTLQRELQLHIPAFLRQRFMSATGLQQLVSGLYTSTLFLTKGPSCPPTAYRSPSRTPTPGDYQGDTWN